MQATIIDARYALAQSFTISRGSRTHAHIIEITLSDGVIQGQGACVPYARYGETIESVTQQLQDFVKQHAINTHNMMQYLPAGAARNAIDCAFWDYTAKKQQQPMASLANIAPLQPVTSAYTLSLDTPENMHKQALQKKQYPLLKMKCGSAQDIEAIEAVRHAAPDTQLILDANEAWNKDFYEQALPVLQELNIAMIEQPFHAEQDSILQEVARPIPICADESCHTSANLERLRPLYDMVNIKLDKTGGLTEALQLKKQAQEQGFAIMVGCMVGSSLTIAPAFCLCDNVAYIDLDAPMLLKEDCPHALQYEGAILQAPTTQLWG